MSVCKIKDQFLSERTKRTKQFKASRSVSELFYSLKRQLLVPSFLQLSCLCQTFLTRAPHILPSLGRH